MNPSDAPASKRRRLLGRQDTPAERQARLASFAMDRGQINALRRYLAEGLDPQSHYHYGYSGPGGWTLIEKAAARGLLDCFRALEAAGARITDDAIMGALENEIDGSVLAHLLATGKFDPRTPMQDGCAWIDYVGRCGSPHASSAIARALCELERAELGSATALITVKHPRRFL